jgi:hypothetical protein
MYKALTFIATIAALLATPTIAAASNIDTVALMPQQSTPVTVKLTNTKGHLLDFSNSNRSVVGVWVDDPVEFAKSFQVESANGDPRLISIRSIVGGSSRIVINLITVDDRDRQYIQPIELIKRSSPQNITQFFDRPQADSQQAATELARGFKIATDLSADPDRVAQEVGVSPQFVAKLIALGTRK